MTRTLQKLSVKISVSRKLLHYMTSMNRQHHDVMIVLLNSDTVTPTFQKLECNVTLLYLGADYFNLEETEQYLCDGIVVHSIRERQRKQGVEERDRKDSG